MTWSMRKGKIHYTGYSPTTAWTRSIVACFVKWLWEKQRQKGSTATLAVVYFVEKSGGLIKQEMREDSRSLWVREGSDRALNSRRWSGRCPRSCRSWNASHLTVSAMGFGGASRDRMGRLVGRTCEHPCPDLETSMPGSSEGRRGSSPRNEIEHVHGRKESEFEDGMAGWIRERWREETPFPELWLDGEFQGGSCLLLCRGRRESEVPRLEDSGEVCP